MKKLDYLLLAKKLRLDIDKFQNVPSLGMSQDDYLKLQSDSIQAVNLARYIGQYFSLNRVEFLNVCGVRP